MRASQPAAPTETLPMLQTMRPCQTGGMDKLNLPPVTVASLARQITGTGKEVQLLPDGDFTAVDGRPANLQGVTAKTWKMNGTIAAAMIAALAQRATRVVIDYEHQTQRAAQNGKPAPAAGWYKTLEWRPGVGLFATDVRWTKSAQLAIANDEYLYISPVFSFNPKTGELIALHMAALTNTPGLDDMLPVTLTQFYQPQPQPEEETVNLAALLAQLGLPATTTEAQLTAHLAQLQQANQAQAAQIATLSAPNPSTMPDPAKFVPIELMAGLTEQINTLNATLAANAQANNQVQIAQLVSQGLAQGKLTAATTQWATELGQKEPSLLQAFLAAAPVNPALVGTQTNGAAPVPGQTATLSTTDLQVCSLMGVNPANLLMPPSLMVPA